LGIEEITGGHRTKKGSIEPLQVFVLKGDCSTRLDRSLKQHKSFQNKQMREEEQV